MTPEEEYLSSIGLSPDILKTSAEMAAKEAATRAAGGATAGAAGMVSSIPFVGPAAAEKGLELLTGQKGMREQLRADYPASTLIGELATSVLGAAGAASAGRKAAAYLAPEAAKKTPAVISAIGGLLGETGYGAAEGATQGGVPGALVGGALGAIPGAIDLGSAKMAQKAAVTAAEQKAAKEAAEKANAPILKQIDKLTQESRAAKDELGKLKGDLESEKITKRQSAAKSLDQKQRELVKAKSELAELQGKIERQAEPGKEGLPQYASMQEARKAVAAASKALQVQEDALNKLLIQGEVKLGTRQAGQIEKAAEGVRRAEEKVFGVETDVQLVDALRQMMEEIGKKSKPKSTIAAAPAPIPEPLPAEVVAPTAPAAPKTKKDLQEIERQMIEEQLAINPDAGLRFLQDQLGISRSTLSRRMRNLGITPESAAEAVAARKAAQQAPVPSAAPEAPAKSVFDEPGADAPEKKSLFDEYPITEGDIRKIISQETVLPVKGEAAYGQLERAQKRMAEASAPLPSVEEGMMSGAISRQRALRDQAQAALTDAQERLAEAETLYNFAPAPQAKALYANELAAAQENVQLRQAQLAKAESELASDESAFELATQPRVEAAAAKVASREEEIAKLTAQLQEIPNLSDSAKKTLRQKLLSPQSAAKTASVLGRLFRTSAINEIYDQDVEELLK